MLIPDNRTDFESLGEQILYKKFKYDGSTDSMYVLHSVFTNYHIKNPCGELEFLVVSPNEGFFTIEVKHGGVSRKKVSGAILIAMEKQIVRIKGLSNNRAQHGIQ